MPDLKVEVVLGDELKTFLSSHPELTIHSVDIPKQLIKFADQAGNIQSAINHFETQKVEVR